LCGQSAGAGIEERHRDGEKQGAPI
jgi:hypothetical protein